MSDFIESLRCMIAKRKKMTSPLYRHILAGHASRQQLQQFVIHRFPVKDRWTRNILGIASQIEDHALRKSLVENIYEEETGALTKTKRHLDTFLDFGRCLGVTQSMIERTPVMPQTVALVAHNTNVCNGGAHFTEGVASVLLLMEGQPPIVTANGASMLQVMRDVYCLPPKGVEFFVHHASHSNTGAVSDLEDEHAAAAEEILRRYCTTVDQQENARAALAHGIELRHAHFDAIFAQFKSCAGNPFRAQVEAV